VISEIIDFGVVTNYKRSDSHLTLNFTDSEGLKKFDLTDEDLESVEKLKYRKVKNDHFS
jgi:hypothetical protein